MKINKQEYVTKEDLEGVRSGLQMPEKIWAHRNHTLPLGPITGFFQNSPYTLKISWPQATYVLEDIHKAEIKKLVNELETMKKVADQAIDLTGLRRYTVVDEPNFICARKVQLQPTSHVPELSAYLKEREKK